MITKKIFENTIEKFFARLKNRIFDKFRKIPFFFEYDDLLLKKLIKHTKLVNTQKNDVVVKEND